MAKPDWRALQAQFLADHAKTDISPKDWCEAQGLKYSTAKRYIKIANSSANSQKKSANKTANSQNKTDGKPLEKSTITIDSGKALLQKKSSKRDPKRSAPEELEDSEKLFVQHYLECRNKFKAYKDAGYKGGERHARLLYRKPSVNRAIKKGIDDLCERLQLRAEDILQQWEDIVLADPGEITQHRRLNCRFCWGENHRYQWRDLDEQLRAEKKAELDKRPPPDFSGGVGFVDNDDPNPECPRCNGEGIVDVHVVDTRDLPPRERRLFAGVKQTKFGIEVLTNDQDSARKNLMNFYSLRNSEVEREKQLLDLELARLRNERERLELAKLKSAEEDEDVTPVVVSINVVDARVRPQDGDDSSEP